MDDFLLADEQIPADHPSDFRRQAVGDGAVLAIFPIGGSPAFIVRFAELTPDHFVLGGYQSCEEIRTEAPQVTSAVAVGPR